MSIEHSESAQRKFTSKDPETKRMLGLMRRWWEPEIGRFKIPARNSIRVRGGYYEREELYPLLVGGYKPGEETEVREKLIRRSRDVFEAMLSYDDANPLFQQDWSTKVDLIDS